jgi:hypothetical protein
VSVGRYSYPKNVGLLEQGCGLLTHTLYPVSCSAYSCKARADVSNKFAANNFHKKVS